jgi:hypothetical protein
MSKLLRPLCGTLALVTFATATADAQATIGVSADVSTQLTVTGTRALEFGTVYPGFSKPIAATAPTAGKFTLNGGPGANVNITLTLPTTLASGTNTMGIASWTGCRNTTDAVTGCTTFVPSGTAFTTPLGAGGVLVVFLGATVTAVASQVAGTYTGTVSMTAAYTGT